jgi:hypothetical protein
MVRHESEIPAQLPAYVRNDRLYMLPSRIVFTEDTKPLRIILHDDQGRRFIYTIPVTATKRNRSFIPQQFYPNESLNYTNQRTYKTSKNQRESFDETHCYEVLYVQNIDLKPNK